MHDTLSQSDLFGTAEATPSAEDVNTAGAIAVPPIDPHDADAAGHEAALKDYAALIDAVVALEAAHRDRHGDKADSLGIDPEVRINVRREVVFDALLRSAANVFSGYGVSLTLDRAHYKALFLPDRDRSYRDGAEDKRRAICASFSPVSLWQRLKLDLASSGQVQAQREAAHRLLKRLPFGRLFETCVKPAGNGTSFHCSLTTESKFDGTLQVGYHNRYEKDYALEGFVRALAVFLAWCHGTNGLRPEDSSDVDEFNNWLNRGDARFASGDKRMIGPITLTFFKSKMTVRVPKPLDEKLNLFLVEFAGERLNELMSM